jgi:hypothetical protein
VPKLKLSGRKLCTTGRKLAVCGCGQGTWPNSGWIVGTPCKPELVANRPIVLSVASIRAYLLATYGSETPADVSCVVATASTNIGPVCARFGPGMPVVTGTLGTYVASGIVENCCTCGYCRNNVSFNVFQTQLGNVSVTLPTALCCLPQSLPGDVWRNVGTAQYNSVRSGEVDGTRYTGVITASFSWDESVADGAGQILIPFTLTNTYEYTYPDNSTETQVTQTSQALILQVTPATFKNGWYLTGDGSGGFALNFLSLEQLLAGYLRTAATPNVNNSAMSGSVTVTCDSIAFSMTRPVADGSETWTGSERWTPSNTRGCGPRCGALVASPPTSLAAALDAALFS